MSNNQMFDMIKDAVLKTYDDTRAVYPPSKEDCAIVWFCKTLQNYKAIVFVFVAGAISDFFEVTYNGDKNELYVDKYKKEKNVKFICNGLTLID